MALDERFAACMAPVSWNMGLSRFSIRIAVALDNTDKTYVVALAEVYSGAD